MRVNTRDLMPLISELGYDRRSHPLPVDLIQEAATRLQRLRALSLNARALELPAGTILERIDSIIGKGK